mgnify:CR=1 FL=1
MNPIYLLWDYTEHLDFESRFIVGYIADKGRADAEADRLSREWHKIREARHNERMRNQEGLPYNDQDRRFEVEEVLPIE